MDERPQYDSRHRTTAARAKKSRAIDQDERGNFLKVSMMMLSENAENFNKDGAGRGALIASFIRYEEPVGKRYGYEDGELTKAFSPLSRRAVGETLSFPSSEEFMDWRKALPAECMLLSGTFEIVGEVPVVLKGKEGPGEVSRSKTYLAHREQPGVLIIDIDFKDRDEVAGLYPSDVKSHETLDSALYEMSKVLPEADNCALLIGWSTSSNIFNMDGVQVKATGGIRIYLPVTDASKIPELLKTIHQRCWLHGLGWAFVGSGGRFHERSLVDLAMGRVTQPDFAAPDLRDGLIQSREWQDYIGDWLDPADVAPLSQEESARYLESVGAAKRALSTDMAVERERWLTEQVEVGSKKGVSSKRARAAAIQRLDNGTLLPTDVVTFADGRQVPCLKLLTVGAAHDGEPCLDPVEPGYNDGAIVARYSWNNGERPGIHSFAHGSKWYALKHDAESAKEVIAGADADSIHLALALTEYSSGSKKLELEKSACRALGLGNSVTVLRADVDEVRKRIYRNTGGKALDATSQAAISEGRWPIDNPLPPEIFSFKRGDALISHPKNYKTMMAAYGYSCSYDVIKKDISWTGPRINMTTDNAYLALFSTMKGLAALNGLPHGNADLHTHLPAIAEENQINPVRDYLADLEWDGKERFAELANAMEPHDTEIAEIALRVWFTGAAAACEHFETGLKLLDGARPSFEYVLALLGAQGVNKTKGFLRFVPKALGKYVKDGLSIKPGNKDSVKIAVSNWLVELGELDATFGQGQIAELKAFLSTENGGAKLVHGSGGIWLAAGGVKLCHL